MLQPQAQPLSSDQLRALFATKVRVRDIHLLGEVLGRDFEYFDPAGHYMVCQHRAIADGSYAIENGKLCTVVGGQRACRSILKDVDGKYSELPPHLPTSTNIEITPVKPDESCLNHGKAR